MKTILTAITGSRAHGTFNESSDIDTRSIYMVPTIELISIGNYQKFIENKESDDNAWEVAHFIYLSLRCNPSTLEAIVAEPQTNTEWGEELRQLLPAFLHRRHAYNAFKGFAIGQRKKMVSPTTNYFRKPKAAAHYLRVLYNGIELLKTGTFTVKITDTPIGQYVIDAKVGNMLFEEVLDKGDELFKQIDEAYEKSIIPEDNNKEAINKFLIKVRKEYWEDEAV